MLDEADRMLGMGFEAPLRDILGHIPQEEGAVATWLFTATWAGAVTRFAALLGPGEYACHWVVRFFIGFFIAHIPQHRLVPISKGA